MFLDSFVIASLKGQDFDPEYMPLQIAITTLLVLVRSV